MTSRGIKAFTLVELIMVIVIIGLLAAVVTPKFTDMKTQAQSAAETGAVSAIRSGINMYYMNELTKGNNSYPSTLDSASNGVGSASNLLFTNIIEGGVSDPNWEKTGAAAYKYKPANKTYTYTSGTGKFE